MPAPQANPAVPFTVMHQDARVVVVDKPAGVVTEPGLGHRNDSLLNGLFCTWGQQLTALGERRDFGLLHRLDRDTSGPLVIALDDAAYDSIRAQFEQRRVGKRYLALVTGKPPAGSGTIDLPLAEVRRGDMKVSVVDRSGGATPTITRYRVLGRGNGQSLVVLELVTGKLHQIRAHLAEVGCPVVNDPIYRVDLPPKTSAPPRGRDRPPLALHAWELQFVHPDGQTICARSPLPESFSLLLAKAQIPLPSELSQ